MFPRIARLFGIRQRRRARHAAPPPSARHPLHITHGPFEPLGRGLMGQRPLDPWKPAVATQTSRTDYRDPAPLGALKPFTASDGQTLLIHHIGDGPQPETPLPPSCTATTVVHDAVETARFADPTHWYGRPDAGDDDWPDVPTDAPSLTGTFDNGDQTPLKLRIMRDTVPVLAHSALTHRAGLADPWFRGPDSRPRYERSLKSFIADEDAKARARDRRLADLNGRYPAAGEPQAVRRTAGVLNTQMMPAVDHEQFAGTDRAEGPR